MGMTIRPVSLHEALLRLSEQPLIPLNGGTDLMVAHRAQAGTLPDFDRGLLVLGHLEELQSIRVTPEMIRIGSGVTLTEILEHPQVPEAIKCPLRQIGSLAIRNMGTLTGNLCHASPAGDSLPMLYALEARVECRSLKGTRSVAVAEFILGPGRTCLNPDELVTALEIPHPGKTKGDYLKLGGRSANAIAKLSLYTAYVVEGTRILDVRISFGALAPTVVRLREAERLLVERGIDVIPEVLDLYRSHLCPIDDLRSTREYRLTVSLDTLEKFLREELTHAS